MACRLIRSSVCVLVLLGSVLSAAHAANYRNFLGMVFKDIEAGSFYMGSCKQQISDPLILQQLNQQRVAHGLEPLSEHPPCPSGGPNDDNAFDSELPQHQVTIEHGFQMGVFEVTLGQFRRYIEAAGRQDLLTELFNASNRHGDSAAVTMVSWQDAQDFIRWINTNKPTDDKALYRLPSEAEWEYAARAGSVELYGFGSSAERLPDYAWYADNADIDNRGYAHAGGEKKPNQWGLYDMHGNVLEWVDGCWHEGYWGAPKDGSAWGTQCDGIQYFHIFRGGSWSLNYTISRSAYRYYNEANYHHPGLGLRLVRQPQ